MFNKILAYSILLAFPLTATATDKPKEPSQEQSQDQLQHQSQQQYQNVDTANSQSVSFQDRKQAPDAFAPSIAPTAPCYYSASGGLSIPGVGVSGGKAIKDEACELRENIRLAYQIGLASEAYALFCAGPGKDLPNCGMVVVKKEPEPAVTVILGDQCAASVKKLADKCVAK